MPVTLTLVKHAQPVLDPRLPPREWRLGVEGIEQSGRLAERLKPGLPFRLVCSVEPKAVETARIVAAELGIPHRVVDGLEEIDRRATPIVSLDEHERINAALFADRSAAIVGVESADAALARFSAAIDRAINAGDPRQPLVVIAHGTVISLFVEQRTGRDAFETWRTLQCAEYVVV